MYTNILIPTDGSKLAEKAVEHGIALAKKIGAKVTALTVLSPFRYDEICGERHFQSVPTIITWNQQ
jgi:nucleotide-binding universal stress UspA family protein